MESSKESKESSSEDANKDSSSEISSKSIKDGDSNYPKCPKKRKCHFDKEKPSKSKICKLKTCPAYIERHEARKCKSKKCPTKEECEHSLSTPKLCPHDSCPSVQRHKKSKREKCPIKTKCHFDENEPSSSKLCDKPSCPTNKYINDLKDPNKNLNFGGESNNEQPCEKDTCLYKPKRDTCYDEICPNSTKFNSDSDSKNNINPQELCPNKKCEPKSSTCQMPSCPTMKFQDQMFIKDMIKSKIKEIESSPHDNEPQQREDKDNLETHCKHDKCHYNETQPSTSKVCEMKTCPTNIMISKLKENDSITCPLGKKCASSDRITCALPECPTNKRFEKYQSELNRTDSPLEANKKNMASASNKTDSPSELVGKDPLNPKTSTTDESRHHKDKKPGGVESPQESSRCINIKPWFSKPELKTTRYTKTKAKKCQAGCVQDDCKCQEIETLESCVTGEDYAGHFRYVLGACPANTIIEAAEEIAKWMGKVDCSDAGGRKQCVCPKDGGSTESPQQERSKNELEQSESKSSRGEKGRMNKGESRDAAPTDKQSKNDVEKMDSKIKQRKNKVDLAGKESKEKRPFFKSRMREVDEKASKGSVECSHTSSCKSNCPHILRKKSDGVSAESKSPAKIDDSIREKNDGMSVEFKLSEEIVDTSHDTTKEKNDGILKENQPSLKIVELSDENEEKYKNNESKRYKNLHSQYQELLKKIKTIKECHCCNTIQYVFGDFQRKNCVCASEIEDEEEHINSNLNPQRKRKIGADKSTGTVATIGVSCMMEPLRKKSSVSSVNVNEVRRRDHHKPGRKIKYSTDKRVKTAVCCSNSNSDVRRSNNNDSSHHENKEVPDNISEKETETQLSNSLESASNKEDDKAPHHSQHGKEDNNRKDESDNSSLSSVPKNKEKKVHKCPQKKKTSANTSEATSVSVSQPPSKNDKNNLIVDNYVYAIIYSKDKGTMSHNRVSSGRNCGDISNQTSCTNFDYLSSLPNSEHFKNYSDTSEKTQINSLTSDGEYMTEYSALPNQNVIVHTLQEDKKVKLVELTDVSTSLSNSCSCSTSSTMELAEECSQDNESYCCTNLHKNEKSTSTKSKTENAAGTDDENIKSGQICNVKEKIKPTRKNQLDKTTDTINLQFINVSTIISPSFILVQSKYDDNKTDRTDVTNNTIASQTSDSFLTGKTNFDLENSKSRAVSTQTSDSLIGVSNKINKIETEYQTIATQTSDILRGILKSEEIIKRRNAHKNENMRSDSNKEKMPVIQELSESAKTESADSDYEKKNEDTETRGVEIKDVPEIISQDNFTEDNSFLMKNDNSTITELREEDFESDEKNKKSPKEEHVADITNQEDDGNENKGSEKIDNKVIENQESDISLAPSKIFSWHQSINNALKERRRKHKKNSKKVIPGGSETTKPHRHKTKQRSKMTSGPESMTSLLDEFASSASFKSDVTPMDWNFFNPVQKKDDKTQTYLFDLPPLSYLNCSSLEPSTIKDIESLKTDGRKSKLPKVIKKVSRVESSSEEFIDMMNIECVSSIKCTTKIFYENNVKWEGESENCSDRSRHVYVEDIKSTLKNTVHKFKVLYKSLKLVMQDPHLTYDKACEISMCPNPQVKT